jgi:hypothetical protein
MMAMLMRPRSSLRLLANALLALAVGACSGAPPGFDAVPPATLPTSGEVCPDLRGTYVPGADTLMSAFLTTPRPSNYGYEVRLSITGAPDGIQNAVWHMDRAEFLAQARDFKARRPDQYARWRARVLSNDRTNDPRRYVAQVTELGPFFSIDAGLTGRQCNDAWRLAAVRDDPARPLETEVWLARNRDGALLVKSAVREVSFSAFSTSARGSAAARSPGRSSRRQRRRTWRPSRAPNCRSPRYGSV